MGDRSGGLSSLADVLVPIHRDGHKFVAGGVLATVVLFLLWPALAWLVLLATGCIAYFFRDPDRVTPLREGLVIAPADGRIVAAEKVRPPPELGFGDSERTRISIHLSLFDVHVNRSPVCGQVVRSIYVPGAFHSATLDKASEENERRILVIATADGLEVAVAQIAGLISRRIVTFAGEGDTLGIGQRFGLIRFGSRVDVYLPPGRAAHVAVGQRAIAGETVLADLKSDEPQRHARRN
ncbi:MAG TPA: phosphatidylserine decarboxylase [Hyphomicrobiaceae bacterium]|nr:phosphatidylserine decarboxylase [Hyphomicrobiaceae bacterium]